MTSTTNLEGKSPKFDKLSFVKFVKDIGRAYQRQAMELVATCRTLLITQEETPASDADLRIALGAVDDALGGAAEAEKKTSEEVDEKFDVAIQKLDGYYRRYHPEWQVSDFRKRVGNARGNDQSSSRELKELARKSRPIEPQPEEMVKFLIHKSLPDKSPTPVTQVLCRNSDQNEVLWNFTRFKGENRLRLKQNPQFYISLPKSPVKYGDEFEAWPIERFLHKETNGPGNMDIDVLTDTDTGRVYLETAPKKRRAFGNVWSPHNAIIFKDLYGRLEGESIVGIRLGKAIQVIQGGPNIWCIEELPPNGSSPSPTTALQDWSNPIREMLKNARNVDYNVRITRTPPNSIPGDDSNNPSTTSPPPRSLFSGSDGSLLQSEHSQSLASSASTLQGQVLGSSAGPPTPSPRTAQNTPLSGQSPVAGPGPERPEHVDGTSTALGETPSVDQPPKQTWLQKHVWKYFT